MSSELDVVRDCPDFILAEDWSVDDCCKTGKKRTIQSCPRSLDGRGRRLRRREIEELPVVLQVREWAEHCRPDAKIHIGIYPSDIPDSPGWPAEVPLVYWNESMYSLAFHKERKTEGFL